MTARLVPVLHGVLIAVLLLATPAAAEWGRYGSDGWPVDTHGHSTAPAEAGPLNQIGPLTVYPYWALLTAELTRLVDEHPDRARLHSAGKSTAGLDLWMLEIADFENPNAVPLEEREVVWVDGGTHSNEYSGVYFAARLASFLLDEYETNETAKWIVENRHTWIMPMVNPDGSHAFGRLNARAVNVNRNYPVGWGALAENPVMNNPGPAPASEVETQINLEWFNKTRPDLYVSIHCCGNLWLFPYGIEGIDPLDKQTLDRVCDEAFASVREDCGPIWSTIYPASGSSVDSVYELTGAVAFGYEMSGRGAAALWGHPFTAAPVEEQEVESWEGILHGFLNVHKYGAHPEVESLALVDGVPHLFIKNTGYGNLTAGNVTHGETRYPIPFLAPGESAVVAVPVPHEPGIVPLTLEYTKRIMAAPQGVKAIPLEVTRTPIGELQIALADGVPMTFADTPAGSDFGVPLSPLLALTGLVGAALVRRARAT